MLCALCKGCGLNYFKNEDNIGDLIDGRYRLTQLIGRGGSGVVYKATDVNLHREIAVKLMSNERVHDESVYRRFEREGRILRKLRHPNTVFFYDSGKTSKGLPYIAMEYVQGKQLKDLLSKTPIIPPERAVPILIQILSSLHEAHSLGFVHRDLKPSNIMLCDNTDFPDDFVKVLDFGVATLAEQHERAPDSPDATLSIDVVGTPKYMAPEQFRSAPLTTLSDLYSLGCIAYEMLAGFMPFDGDTFHMVIANHLFQKVPPFQAELDRYPVLTSTILQLLEKEPENRIQTAEEVITLLENWRGSSSAMPSPMLAQSMNAHSAEGVSAQMPQTINNAYSAHGTAIPTGVFNFQLKRQALVLLIFTLAAVVVATVSSAAITSLSGEKKLSHGSEITDIEQIIENNTGMAAIDNPFYQKPEDFAYLVNSITDGAICANAIGLLDVNALKLSKPASEGDIQERPMIAKNAEKNSEAAKKNVEKPSVEDTQAKAVKKQAPKADPMAFLDKPFEITVKYTPVYATVKFVNLTGRCQRGTCKLKTINNKSFPKISVDFAGYSDQTVTIKRKQSAVSIDLKRKTM